MIIVQGVFQVAPANTKAFLAETVETQRISRAEPGCIEYVFAADPLEPGRIVLSERWETRALLDAHIDALVRRRAAEAEAGATPMEPISREVFFFKATEFDLNP